MIVFPNFTDMMFEFDSFLSIKLVWFCVLHAPHIDLHPAADAWDINMQRWFKGQGRLRVGLGLLKSSPGGGEEGGLHLQGPDLRWWPDGEKLLCLEKMCNLFLLIFNRWKERERNDPSRKWGQRRGHSKMRVGLTLYSDNRLEALLGNLTRVGMHIWADRWLRCMTTLWVCEINLL